MPSYPRQATINLVHGLGRCGSKSESSEQTDDQKHNDPSATGMADPGSEKPVSPPVMGRPEVSWTEH